MKVKFKKDFRKFKENQEINLDFDKYDLICLVGSNGSGKSTIAYAIQALKATSERKNYMAIGGSQDEFKESVEVTDCDFNKIETICVVRDDPSSYNLCASADEFIDNGGWDVRFMSHGNKLSYMFVKSLKSLIVKDKENTEAKKNLIVIDEIDSGLDLKMCYNMGRKGLKNIAKKTNAKIIFITHNPILLLLFGEDERTGIFDIEKLEYTTATHYIRQITNGLNVKIDYPK